MIELSTEIDEDGELKPMWRVLQEKKLSKIIPKLSNKELYNKVFRLAFERNAEEDTAYFTYGDWVTYNVHKKELDKRLSDWLEK